MANVPFKNEGWIKQTDPKLWEALAPLFSGVNNVAEQTNAAPIGQTPSSQPHSKLTVTGGAGVYDIRMEDENPQYRGLENFVDYSQDPNFAEFHTIHVGATNNHRASLGAGQYYFRSYTQYQPGSPSAYCYHDGVVDGSGNTPPAMQANAGSGTGDKGYGEQPYLSQNGQVPTR